MSKNAEQKAAHEAAYAIVGELVIGATMLDHPQIAWAKLEALVAGAELASRKLWGPAKPRHS
jgi:hypothetical protein